MDKETIEREDDFNIEELLGEDDDSPVEESKTPIKPIKKAPVGKPREVAEEIQKPEVPVEVTETNKELENMQWQPFSQPAFEGYQNVKTGEVIDEREVLRRILCYAQEAARGSR